jgi:hypothetical protein
VDIQTFVNKRGVGGIEVACTTRDDEHLKIACKHHIRTANMIRASIKPKEGVADGNGSLAKLTVGGTSEIEHFQFGKAIGHLGAAPETDWPDLSSADLKHPNSAFDRRITSIVSKISDDGAHGLDETLAAGHSAGGSPSNSREDIAFAQLYDKLLSWNLR